MGTYNLRATTVHLTYLFLAALFTTQIFQIITEIFRQTETCTSKRFGEYIDSENSAHGLALPCVKVDALHALEYTRVAECVSAYGKDKLFNPASIGDGYVFTDSILSYTSTVPKAKDLVLGATRASNTTCYMTCPKKGTSTAELTSSASDDVLLPAVGGYNLPKKIELAASKPDNKVKFYYAILAFMLVSSTIYFILCLILSATKANIGLWLFIHGLIDAVIFFLAIVLKYINMQRMDAGFLSPKTCEFSDDFLNSQLLGQLSFVAVNYATVRFAAVILYMSSNIIDGQNKYEGDLGDDPRTLNLKPNDYKPLNPPIGAKSFGHRSGYYRRDDSI